MICKLAVEICFILFLILIDFVHLLSITGNETASMHNKQVICNFCTWSIYRLGRGSFDIDNIDPTLCTHIVYAYAGINESSYEVISIDPLIDFYRNHGKGCLRRISNLKKKYSHLKVILSIGGYNEGSLKFSKLSKTSTRRKKFIKSALIFVKTFGLDGINIDWQYPAEKGGNYQDKNNFVLLIKEIKEEFAKKKLIITSTLGALLSTINNAYNIRELAKYLDLIQLKTYEYHGFWDMKVHPGSSVYEVENSILQFLTRGAPPEKLIVGIASFGNNYATEDVISELKSPILSKGPKGKYTNEVGYHGYNEICLKEKEKDWVKKWDNLSCTPYIVKDNIIMTYDDGKSVAEKVKVGIKYKVGGFMLWSLETDDFRGDCAKRRDKKPLTYPLLRYIHRAAHEYANLSEKKIFGSESNSTQSAAYALTPQTNYLILIMPFIIPFFWLLINFLFFFYKFK